MIRRLANQMRQKEDRVRHLKAALSSFILLSEAAIVAGLATLIWYYLFWKCGLHFEAESEVRASTIVLLLGGVFAIAAAITLTETVSKTAEMSRHILEENEKAFLVLRDIHIPRRMHVVLGSYGGGALLIISLFGYHTVYEGATYVFICYFAFTVYFSATLELQDILESAWFKRHAPDGWLTCTVIDRLKAIRTAENELESIAPSP